MASGWALRRTTLTALHQTSSSIIGKCYLESNHLL